MTSQNAPHLLVSNKCDLADSKGSDLTSIECATAVVALLVNPTNPNAATQSRTAKEAAQRLGVQLHIINASNASDFDPTFAKMRELQVAALMIGQDILFGNEAEQLAKLSVRYRIPAIDAQREFAAAGGLMSYGANIRDAYRQVGIYAGRILKGEKPSDLPVIQAVKFDLVINLKTAKAFGLKTCYTLRRSLALG